MSRPDRDDMDDILTFPDRRAFRAWLGQYGADSGGVWLLFGNKGGPATLTANEALEEALCFGWIDGRTQRIDSTRYKRTGAIAWNTTTSALKARGMTRTLFRPSTRSACSSAASSRKWL